jgi:excisionase family DNA binding protein
MAYDPLTTEQKREQIVKTFRDAGEYIGQAIASLILHRTDQELEAEARAALPPLMTMQGAADYLSISRSQLYALVDRGEMVKPVRMKNRPMFRRSDLDKYIAKMGTKR